MHRTTTFKQLTKLIMLDELPNEFLCPITQEMMQFPVFAADGHSYERSAIQTWFETNQSQRSPMTNEILSHTNLTPNHALKKMIDRHRNGVAKHLLELCARGPSSTSQLEALVDRGADLNIRDENGNTPLMLLLQNDMPGFIKALVRMGASVLTKNDAGTTLLDMARSKRPRDEAIVHLIHKLERVEKEETEKENIRAAQGGRSAEEQTGGNHHQQQPGHNNNRWQHMQNWFRGFGGNNNNGEGQGQVVGGPLVGSFFFFGTAGFGSGPMAYLPILCMAAYMLWNNPHILQTVRQQFQVRTSSEKVGALFLVLAIGLMLLLRMLQLP
jgi:hypothetical protein